MVGALPVSASNFFLTKISRTREVLLRTLHSGRGRQKALDAITFVELPGTAAAQPGTRFGRWVVVKAAEPVRVTDRRMRRGWSLHKAALVECSCSSGTRKTKLLSELKAGRSKSCGCLQREAAATIGRQQAEHGGSGSPEHRVWLAMRRRCYLKTSKDYPRYGGRGIEVWPAWRDDFGAFACDIGKRPTPRHTLERLDNDGNYEPGNVAWVLPKDQARNRSSTVWVFYEGGKVSLAEAAEREGVPYKKAWSLHKAGKFPAVHAKEQA